MEKEAHLEFVQDNLDLTGLLPQVAEYFDSTIAKGADIKMATNWIMGDIAAYMKNEKLSINDIKLTPEELAELIANIKSGTISGKIGKEVNSPLSFDSMLYSHHPSTHHDKSSLVLRQLFYLLLLHAFENLFQAIF